MRVESITMVMLCS